MPKKKKKQRDKWEFAVEGETHIARSLVTGHYVKNTPVKVTEDLLPRLWRTGYTPSDEQKRAALAGYVIKSEFVDEDNPKARTVYTGRYATREAADAEARREVVGTVWDHTPKPRKWKLEVDGETFTARPAAAGYAWYDAFTVEETEAAEQGRRFAVVATFVDIEHPTPGRQIVDRYATRDEALTAARASAQAVVDENNPEPKPKGSFTRDGEPKECRECGNEGEDCECWRDEEDGED